MIVQVDGLLQNFSKLVLKYALMILMLIIHLKNVLLFVLMVNMRITITIFVWINAILIIVSIEIIQQILVSKNALQYLQCLLNKVQMNVCYFAKLGFLPILKIELVFKIAHNHISLMIQLGLVFQNVQFMKKLLQMKKLENALQLVLTILLMDLQLFFMLTLQLVDVYKFVLKYLKNYMDLMIQIHANIVVQMERQEIMTQDYVWTHVSSKILNILGKIMLIIFVQKHVLLDILRIIEQNHVSQIVLKVFLLITLL